MTVLSEHGTRTCRACGKDRKTVTLPKRSQVCNECRSIHPREKWCFRCRLWKDQEAFSIDHHHNDGRNNRCRKCVAELEPDHKEAYARYNRSAKGRCSRRRSHYRRVYGVSLEAFYAQVAWQGNRCPIGFHPFGPLGTKTGPCLDHNHRTGKNRGIVCWQHNNMLGLLKIDLGDKIVQNVLQYMREHADAQNLEMANGAH